MAAGTTIAKAVLELSTDNAAFNKGLDDASAKSKKTSDDIGRQFASVGKQLNDVGKSLLPLSGALAGVGAGILAVGAAFDSAFDTIRVGTGATGKALDGLKDSFRTVLAGVPDDADKVAKALADVNTRLGLTGKPLESLTTQLLTLARITKTDINELIPQATRVFGDWKVSTEQQGQTLDYLFKVSQSTGVGVSDLMAKVTDSGAAFKALGFDLEQSAALLGAWEQNGVNTDTMLSGLQKAATGFAKANIPVADGLKTVVDRMLALGPGTESAKLATQVFGKAAIGMADAIFKGQLNVDALVASLNTSQETIRGAAADTDDFAEQWGTFKNQLLLALEPLGGRLFSIINNLMPLLQGLIGKVSDAAKWFGSLPESVQATAIALAGFAGLAGPGLLAMGQLVVQLPKIEAGITALRVALTGLATNPYVLAITALAAAFVVLKGEVDKAHANVQRLADRQRDGADATKTWKGAIDGAGNAIVDLTNLTDEQKRVMSGVNTSMLGLGITLNQVGDNAKGAGTDIGALTGEQEKNKKAADAAAKAERDYAESMQAIRDALKDLGLITSGTVNEQLGEFQKTISLALAGGAALPQVLGQMLPRMVAFADAAEASGANVADLRAGIEQFRGILAQTAPTLNKFVTAFDPTKPISGLKAITGETYAAQKQAERTREAYAFFGLELPEDLRAAAQTAVREFTVLAQSGTASKEELVEAWKKVQEAIDKANGKVAATALTWADVNHVIGASLGDLSGALDDLGLHGVAAFLRIGEAANRAGQQMKAGVKDMSGPNATKGDKFAGAVEVGVGALQAAGAIDQATRGKGKAAGAGSGALAGAEAGMAFGPWGAAIGAGAGALTGWIRGMGAGRDAVKDFAKEFDTAAKGTGFDELHDKLLLMGDAGENLWKQLSDVSGGNVAGAQAAIDKVNRLLGSQDGILKQNAARAQELLGIYQSEGALSVDEMTELGNTLTSLADDAEKHGGLWSSTLKDLIAQTKGLGAATEQVNALIDAQLDKIAGATSKVTGGLTGLLSRPSQQLDDLTAQQQDQTARGDLEGAADTAQQIKDLTQQTVDGLQGDFDRLNRITLASFNAYVANGHTPLEAIQAVGPAFDQLQAAADKFGFAGSEAFNQLSRWRELTTVNQPLLDQVSGLNDLMVALSNTGSLDAATFADLQAQGASTFESLTKAGFTQNEALAQMAPMLQTIKDLHEENGFAIDDATQKLIDQADAQGVLKETGQSTNDILIGGLGAIIEAVGGKLPKAFQDFTKAGKQAATDVGDALTKIPDPEITFKYNVPPFPDFPGSDQGGGSPNPQYDESGTTPGFAWGTPDLDFASFRRSGESAILHGDEAVIPRGSGHELASEIAAAMGGMVGGGGRGGVANLYLDSRLIARAVVPHIPGEVKSYGLTRN